MQPRTKKPSIVMVTTASIRSQTCSCTQLIQTYLLAKFRIRIHIHIYTTTPQHESPFPHHVCGWLSRKLSHNLLWIQRFFSNNWSPNQVDYSTWVCWVRGVGEVEVVPKNIQHPFVRDSQHPPRTRFRWTNQGGNLYSSQEHNVSSS